MSGETSLERLLASLTAKLAEGVYVFCSLPDGGVPSGIAPRMVFREAEGVTLIVRESQALAHELPFEFPCRMITLNVHSSLEAVGFIAHIAAELSKHGISVNPVAGFYHDHLFVPEGKEEAALRVLANISGDGRSVG